MPKGEYYTSAEIRIKFGRPGHPISYWSLRELRANGVGPLLGDQIKTRLPFRKVNSRLYIYPKTRIDYLLRKLEEKSRKSL
jgi:hypothetical protein